MILILEGQLQSYNFTYLYKVDEKQHINSRQKSATPGTCMEIFHFYIARVQPAPYPVFFFRASAVKGCLLSCSLCCDKQCMQHYQQTLYVPERHDAKHADDFICCSGFKEFHETRLSNPYLYEQLSPVYYKKP